MIRSHSVLAKMTGLPIRVTPAVWLGLVALGWLIVLFIPASIPFSSWIDYRSVTVADTVVGSPIIVTIDRDIKRDVPGRYIVQLESIAGDGSSFYVYCTGIGYASYHAGAKPRPHIDLDYWMGEDTCPDVLPVGKYRLRTTWIIEPEGFPDKQFTINSNIFAVKPAS